jgi:hypothetical protein
MPVISTFYGIVVLMYYFDNRRHQMPHIHLKSGDDEAVISIPDGDVIEGSLRSNKLRLAQAWGRNSSRGIDTRLGIGCKWSGSIQDRSAEVIMKKVIHAIAIDDFTLDVTF